MKLRYDRREDRLVLELEKPKVETNRFVVTRRMWLQWVRALGDTVTEKSLSAAPIKPSSKALSVDEKPAVLLDSIRLRKTSPQQFKLGLVHGKTIVNFDLNGAELTKLLGILVGLGKGAGWDLDSALSRLGPGKSTPKPPLIAN